MTRSKKQRVVTTLLVLAALQGLAVLGYLMVERSRRATDPQFRYERLARAPEWRDIVLARLDGTTLRQSELSDRPLLLHFWATWCEPCREELPGLVKLARDEPGVRLVAVSLDDQWRDIRVFFAGKVPAEIVRDPTGKLARAFEVSALPDTYLIQQDGAATLRFAGARAWQSSSAREFLKLHAGR